jgi:hypothetical protein
MSVGRAGADWLGTKFVVLHSLGHPGLDDLTRKIYEICEYLSFKCRATSHMEGSLGL